jgi:muramoyltetrapeptide carboxypeptidase LdcA involved in peptidoglycan recycling
VHNLDLGHTRPQLLVPSGDRATIDATARTIALDY